MSVTTLVLFGATGDLAQHKLFPSLFAMKRSCPRNNLKIIAVGRRDYSREEFLEQVQASLTSLINHNEDSWQLFCRDIEYYKMDFFEKNAYPLLADYLSKETNHLFYLSVPPESYPTIIEGLAFAGLHKNSKNFWSRLIIEKPFGTNYASATELNQQIANHFSEEQVYRIDHYLGKETVQNILAFRFANQLFEPVWNNNNLDHIQITVSEKEGIKTRGNFYDATGAFRDIIQNHILQLVTLITMDQPEAFSAIALEKEKLHILKHIRVDYSKTLIGQYKSYKSEANVSPESTRETFAATCFYIDTERWGGVPIYVRTGKKMKEKVSEISVQFKQGLATLFESSSPNVLIFRLQPDEGIAMKFGVKTPHSRLGIQPVKMEFCYSTSFKEELIDAYQVLFEDALSGNQLHTISSEVVEASWKIVDQIIDRKAEFPLYIYEDESWGPRESEKIIQWYADESTVCNGVLLEKNQNN